MRAKRESYHHGTLRETLIEAALAYVELHGHETLSLRDLAQQIGVTRGAPYRHFTERSELLAEVAGRGCVMMLACFDAAIDPEAAPFTQFRAGSLGLLEFTKAHPHLFRLISSREIADTASQEPSLREALRRVFARIHEVMAAALPHLDATALWLRHMAQWSTLTGYAMILQNRLLLPDAPNEIDREKIEAAIIDAAVGPDRGGE